MGAHELTFDEALHEYRLGGVRVPSVTQILAPLCSFEGIPREVLEAKRDLGQRVHFATQLDDEDDLDDSSIEPDVIGYLEGYRRFRRETGATVVLNEQRVFDPVLRVAGTLDRVILLNGKKVLVDLKTSIVLPQAVGAQTSAYLRLLGDNTVTHRAALRLRPNGTYRLDMLTDSDDFSVFMACLTLWWFKESHQ